MNITKKTLLFAIGFILMSGSTYAYKYIGEGGPGGHNGSSNVVTQTRAAACAPASGLRDLQWNNVRALIETGGSLWQNRATSSAAYEVPIDGGVSVLYAGALWLGGVSPDQQLKLAAIRFRTQGNDFWPGPLTNDGFAEIDETTCSEYDRFYVTTRAESQRHRQYYEALNSGSVEEEFPDGYATPSSFFDYPAHGNTALNQDLYLAPFYDFDLDGFYDPSAGDYPWYDFLQEINCAERRREDLVPLFGDRNFFWIFNDKGNVHSESQGEPIGMEIRAQAFAFATTDEINDMTFYNYVMINQGTQTLGQTYFGSWIDADVGTASDDYVGCDVTRGLGYAYNGDAVDETSSSSIGYGENPPAVGVDFFEGPYQDNDEIDNPLTTNFSDAIDSLGIPYSGIGIGYGDGFIDNERFGMRKFLYYNNSTGINGEPSTALDYYNYMKGFWRNGQRMSYYGDGLSLASGTDLSIPADYMFPGDTDEFNWGTEGVSVDEWTEVSSGNFPNDRRFIQSAGPFTLEPGDFNNITMGVVYARSTGGDPFESVKLVFAADDKAQALFDNCFEIVSGPDAPDLVVQELDREIILMLTNDNPLSNNYHETKYDDQNKGFDPIIPDEVNGEALSIEDRSYRFQGYMVYQVIDDNVSVTELGDISKSRLIFQCDKEDEITTSINYEIDPEVNFQIVPELLADGSNEGIQHSIRVLKDEFALSDPQLINHKTYYFMAISYAHNNYLDFEEGGQSTQYKQSRKSASGSGIRSIAAIPHNTSPEAGGTTVVSSYGDGVQLTRIEGKGNGSISVELTSKSEEEIIANGMTSSLTYKAGKGPVEIKVVDPIRVKAANYELKLSDYTIVEDTLNNTFEWVAYDGNLESDSVYWDLNMLDVNNDIIDTYRSLLPISNENEELILDWGLSITWGDYNFYDPAEDGKDSYTDLLSFSLQFNDPSRPWLEGMSDSEELNAVNWIRSGTSESGDEALEEEIVYDDGITNTLNFFDPEESYETILAGTWGPFVLSSYSDDITDAFDQNVTVPNVAPRVSPIDFGMTTSGLDGLLSEEINIRNLNNVDVVFTSDKSKWTRCAVFEMQSLEILTESGTGEKLKLREHASVDKNGKSAGESGYSDSEGTLNGAQPEGMGWFPGYAIDVVTGERLNMAFGEDSWMTADNGDDMIWNPSNRIFSELGVNGEVFAGGQHWIYVFKNMNEDFQNDGFMPSYDQGEFVYDNIDNSFASPSVKRIFSACTWVGSAIISEDYPLLSVEDGLIPNEARVSLRVAQPYKKYSPSGEELSNTANASNFWNPLYTFSTNGLESVTSDSDVLANKVLDMINVVPNPYYAFSTYETDKLDNRIKFTNLPEECVINIYNVSGTLIRSFNKADPKTSLDWDLKNEKNIPIAGGVYIVHIDVPDVGEKVLKWFGIMRPIDLDSF